MKKIQQFIYSNKTDVLTFVIGFGLGYLYWYYLGCYWGGYPLSAEWWVNAIYGGIFANIFMDIARHTLIPRKKKHLA